MPKPRKGEKQSKFMTRCVSRNVDEGREQKQAVAICLSVWREHEKAELREVVLEVLAEMAKSFEIERGDT